MEILLAEATEATSGAGVADGGRSPGRGQDAGPAGDGPVEAETAARELGAIGSHGFAALRAMAGQAPGPYGRPRGAAREASPELRVAGRLRRELDVPYEAARVGALIGLACRTLDDEDSAAMELDTAKEGAFGL
ncbi:hypothetical protein ACIO93_20260 [Streptomyces sp. NPDC087903]|uniref:hypothetical protein n=1 Tax=Streptomyces sp. NPDC087903 TaxID=3365819 RepID=UPI003809B850